MPFQVQVDPDNNRMIVTLTGFATINDVQQFEQDIHRAHEILPKHRGAHQLLYDVSEAKVQSQEVVSALRDLAIRSPSKSAFVLVNASALAGRQLNRIFSGMELYRSSNRREAEAWLDMQNTAKQA